MHLHAALPKSASLTDVPFKVAGEQESFVGGDGERSNGLVMSFDDALMFVGTGRVQVVDEARQTDADQGILKPQTTQLLILHCRSEMECSETRALQNERSDK
jgi:hypothetical protein